MGKVRYKLEKVVAMRNHQHQQRKKRWLRGVVIAASIILVLAVGSLWAADSAVIYLLRNLTAETAPESPMPILEPSSAPPDIADKPTPSKEAFVPTEEAPETMGATVAPTEGSASIQGGGAVSTTGPERSDEAVSNGGHISQELAEVVPEKVSLKEKTTVASVLLSKFSAKELQQFASIAKDGITVEEKEQFRGLFLDRLSEKEYNQLIAIAAKYGLSEGRDYQESRKVEEGVQ